ncbi:succinyl-CoA synthetase subunit alpha [mine drainage metagenome]|uniref:Succinyl-CoA synthetase subunit alpha n=1 Tax=mine drainage metagenome TaxID=410659 RepID=A0A1J5QII0_9ZZZZ
MSQLSVLWSARSIAVIGATERIGAMGRLPIEYLQRFGYEGFIAPVNPKGGSILGLPTFSSLPQVDREIDLALILVPAEAVEQAVRECADAGVKTCIVMSSGFAEIGHEGLAAQAKLVEIARTSGMRLLGPNCIGVVGGQHRIYATFSPVFGALSTTAPSGDLALISQSGALGFGALSLAQERSVPLGVAITTGNEADVSAVEIADEISESLDLSGLLIYIESLDDLEPLKRAARRQPIALLKAGRSEAGAAAAASHTGALATEDRVVDAALLKCGIARVDDIEALLDAGSIFATRTKMSGNRVGILTTSGGSGILATDALDKNALTLASLRSETVTALEAIVPAYGNATNPVDVTAAVMSQPGMFERCLDVLADDENVDAIVACFAVLVGEDVTRIARTLGELRKRTHKPIVVARTGAAALAPEGALLMAEAGIPVFPTPERAVRALAALRATSKRDVPESRVTTEFLLPVPQNGASEKDLKSSFASIGLPVPESILVSDVTGARTALALVGGLGVCKAVVPGLLHKSDAGGVVLKVTSAEIDDVYRRLAAMGGEVLVERYVPNGIEVLVGITPSSLGRVLTVGVGGVLTEVFDDVSLRLLPVSEAEVREMIEETRLAKLLAGVRGAPAADVNHLVETILKVAHSTSGWPDGFELDLNPITALADGVWILDAMFDGNRIERE